MNGVNLICCYPRMNVKIIVLQEILSHSKQFL